MPKALIIKNKNKDLDQKVTTKVIEILKNKYEIIKDTSGKPYEDTEVIVVLGGDGTLLKAAKYASEYNIPMLGINLGNLGFMADVEVESIENSLTKFIKGEYKTEKRFMIDGKIIKKDGQIKEISALNDIVITRASYQRMIAFDVEIDGDSLSSYQGDGLVVCTPTGSTAYSMSAGGPVVDPNLDVCIITPVCPHTMSSKPVIVPGKASIEIRFKSTFDDKAMLTSDGQTGIDLSEGDVIKISGSKKITQLIKISERSFYEILNRKLQ